MRPKMCFLRSDSCHSLSQREMKLSPGQKGREWSCWTSLKRVDSKTSFWPSPLLGLLHPASVFLGIKASGEVEVNIEGLFWGFNPLRTKNLSKHSTVFLEGVKIASFCCLKGSALPHPCLVSFRDGSIPNRAWETLKRSAVPKSYIALPQHGRFPPKHHWWCQERRRWRRHKLVSWWVSPIV